MSDGAAHAGFSRAAGRLGSSRLPLLLGLGLLAAFAVRLLLLPTYGLRGDMDQYARWAYRLATDLPFGAAYDLDMSYMPVLVAIFGALARAVPAFAVAPDAGDVVVRIALKVPPLLADVAIAAGLAVLLRPRRPLAVAAVLAFLLVPASWYLSAGWGQFDSIYVALCLWTAILAMRDRQLATGILLGLAMMTKPQALFLAAPFAGYLVGRWGLRRSVLVGLVAGAVAAATWLPFLPHGGLSAYLGDLDYYQNQLYPVLSARTWNAWWLVQEPLAGERWLSDSAPLLGPFTARHLGIAMTAIGELLVLVAVLRRPSRVNLLAGMAAATMVAFCLMTGLHERYAFPALVFLAPLLADRRIIAAWAVLATSTSLNLVAAAPPFDLPPGGLVPLAGPLGLAAAMANVAATGALLWLLVRGRLGNGLLPGADQGAATKIAPSASS